MKVLIDIPQEMFKATQTYYSNNTTRLSIKSCIEKIANGTPIPNNPTNGDMIKAMFPNAIIEINELGSMVHVKYNNHTCWVNYELEWWNAPYKESEGVNEEKNHRLY